MTVALSARPLRRGHNRPPHIVDVLIAERAPKLSSSRLWPLARPLLYWLLDYRQARRLADRIAPMPGRAALEHVSRLLALKIDAQGLERVPRQGRLVVVCNHPTGIADGVAVYDALKTVRPDLCFYANADAHRVSPGLEDVLIPVQWMEAKRTRERARRTLRLTKAAMDAGRCLVMFPAGRIARRQPEGSLSDPPWAPTAVSIARRYGAAVVPVHVAGPWSTLFHFFHGFSPELRDITLFHELLNKRGRNFSLTVGPPIPPDALAGEPGEVTERLKAHVEHGLAANPAQVFA